MTLYFYKEPNGRWYADIPSFIEQGGTKEALEMVAGADTFLDLCFQGENEGCIKFDVTSFENTSFQEELIKIMDTPEIGGALYKLISYKGIELNWEMWLCDVLKFVFGEIPEKIYFKL